MIQLSGNTIMILRPDAVSVPLDIEEIQTRIIRACIGSGETESWIAGDLSLSIEFALLSSNRRFLREAELDMLIERALEDSGYPRVAEAYRKLKNPGGASTDLEITEENVRKAISSNFSAAPETLKDVSARVVQSLHAIGFRTCSPRLMLELAREFRDSDLPHSFELRAEAHPLKTGEEIVLIRPEELFELGSENVRRLIGAGVLHAHEIRRLFCVLKLDLSLKDLVLFHEFEKPVTELALSLCTGELVSAIGELSSECDSLAFARDVNVKTPVPLYLDFTDSIGFASDFMGCPRGDAEKCVSSLAAAFCAQLTRKPFKVVVS